MTRDSTTKTPTGALEYAKFVFALMIVGIHVPDFASRCFGGADGASAFYFWRGCLVRITVPGFFAITGYLFARSIDGMKSTREQWLRLVRVEKRLTLLWLAWAPINIPVSLFQSYFMMDSPPANLWTFDHFLWGGGYTVAWFIVATMMALPIVLAVNRARCRGLSIAVFGFIYILCLAERPYSGVMPTAVTRLVEFWTSLFASPVFSFAIACPFIALGILTWRRRKNSASPFVFAIHCTGSGVRGGNIRLPKLVGTAFACESRAKSHLHQLRTACGMYSLLAHPEGCSVQRDNPPPKRGGDDVSHLFPDNYRRSGPLGVDAEQPSKIRGSRRIERGNRFRAHPAFPTTRVTVD